jgi:lantibiotic modifying enzyme
VHLVNERFGLPSDLRDRARQTAFDLGERLLHRSRHASPDDEEWAPMRSLSGSSGYSLACMALAQATGDSAYEAAMHAFIRSAASVPDRPEIGLFSGVSGLRAVAAILTKIEPRYGNLVAQSDAYIESELPGAPSQPQTYAAFDLICGWSGARLARCVDGPRKSDRLTDYIAWTLSHKERSRCVHPVREGEPEIDIGMAHGVAGMLATLAITMEDIVSCSDVLAESGRWLQAQAVRRNQMLCWPAAVPFEDGHRFRSAWCYGTPGVASALFAVGARLRDEEMRRTAIEALLLLGARDTQEWIIDESNLCHGTMGNALVFASVGALSGEPTLGDIAARLVEETIRDIQRNDGRCLAVRDDGGRHDTYGELTGSAGVILGLLTLTNDFDSSWMRCHGLQPLP